ncbi:hypothetical protein, partial [Microbulbifer celer]
GRERRRLYQLASLLPIALIIRNRESSKSEFKQLQNFLLKNKSDDIAIKVVPKLRSYPTMAENLKVSIDIQLSSADGYFTLVDRAELSLDKLRAKKEN